MSKDPTGRQSTHTLKLVDDQNLTFDQTKMLHDHYLTDLLLAIKQGNIPPREYLYHAYGLEWPLSPSAVQTQVDSRRSGVLTVDYSKSLFEMISASSIADDCIDLLTVTSEHFPVLGQGMQEFEFQVFQFYQKRPWQSMVDMINDFNIINPWHLASIEHLLAYEALHPTQDGEFAIVAPGSIWKYGFWAMPAVSFDKGKRWLDIEKFSSHVCRMRILTVRKKV